MSGRLAILACGGALPVRLAEACPDALCYALQGVPHELGNRAEEHQVEKLGGLFAAMKAAGVDRMVMAGALTRPALDPTALDPQTMQLVPRIMAAMQGGDDGLLRVVIEVFEEQGFAVLGAHELLPDLTASEELQIGAPDPQDLKDAARAWDILSALSPLDVGQGCVVAAGQVLGIETIQGTDALLRFVSETPEALRLGAGGVYVKAAKRGQDLRVDMPAIGPTTIDGVASAGLAGLVIEAGRVMILEREATLKAVEDAGLFLTARAL
ncbi:LpxI family protein [Roseovarius faecimaris]|uniref:LpxI family protein n=1 Tax=Roseovarius faecimaris TaxID=2494550 RepID=A0A6I6IPE6_9RHOB|nr:UDP-2,3-diacylglucosamine diphosphatase LpxI [Roseovarius faecimaris]QGX98575.1 LpxI family protein [Roseovarius faecimaris]